MYWARAYNKLSEDFHQCITNTISIRIGTVLSGLALLSRQSFCLLKHPLNTAHTRATSSVKVSPFLASERCSVITNLMFCDQCRFRSACASAHSDLVVHCSHISHTWYIKQFLHGSLGLMHRQDTIPDV